jgi:predicted dehydrogenase
MPRTTRRALLKTTALAATGFWLSPRSWAADVTGSSPNERVAFASIGVGGKGNGDSQHVAKHGDLVAICDVDENTLEAKAKAFPKAKKFTDFRKMLDEMYKSIDAVTISTPDHNHACATMMAIKLGKHVYTQKPLAHDVWEARQLRLAAAEHKVATQMGNQGTSGGKFREAVELIQAGYLGAVREVHVWTDRPTRYWKQSPDIRQRPPEAPVPAYLHWDEWLGTAPTRPYAKGVYHSFQWRGWWDFGSGALGDMGCHIANMPFMALKLRHPTAITAESEEVNSETYPGWARVTFEFGQREEMPPVKFTWYEGSKDGKLVLPPRDLLDKVIAGGGATVGGGGGAGASGRRPTSAPNATTARAGGGQQLAKGGSIVVGDKGILYSGHDYGGVWKLLPAKTFADYKAPPRTLPRNPFFEQGANGEQRNLDEGHKVEWIAAIKGGRPALSNFDYAGLLAEFILLGNVAIRAGGQRLEFDGPGLTFTNAPQANAWLKRGYRPGWEVTPM